jgi:signal transduction histidine kinase
MIERVSHDNAEGPDLRTLGRLTSGSLHELANPLVALLGSAELALGDVEPGSKLHDRLALVHRTGSEITEIVRALQAFVRLQDEPDAEQSVAEAARDAVALVERVVPTRGSTFAVSGDATVVAPPGELRARIVELLLDELERAPGEHVDLSVSADMVRVTGGKEFRV